MARLSILKFNNYSKQYWQCKLGFGTSITLIKCDPLHVEHIVKHYADSHLLIDFYFKEQVVDEKSITQRIIQASIQSDTVKSLFILSPAYTDQTRFKEIQSGLQIMRSNYDLDFFQNVQQNLSNHQIAS